MLNTTRKVAVPTAGLVVVNLFLAGTAYATSVEAGVQEMTEALAIIGTIVTFQTGILVYLIRVVVENHKRRTGKDRCTVMDALADQLGSDTQIDTEKAIKVLLDDYMERRHAKSTGRPWEDAL